jgi:hypothetical protein
VQPDELIIPDGAELTVADIEDVETVLGIDFGQIDNAIEHSTAGGRLRIVAALVWVYRRKADPSFTFDAARDLPPATLTAVAERMTAAVGGAATTVPT